MEIDHLSDFWTRHSCSFILIKHKYFGQFYLFSKFYKTFLIYLLIFTWNLVYHFRPLDLSIFQYTRSEKVCIMPSQERAWTQHHCLSQKIKFIFLPIGISEWLTKYNIFINRRCFFFTWKLINIYNKNLWSYEKNCNLSSRGNTFSFILVN